MAVTIIGTAPFAAAKRFAVLCLVFDVLVIGAIAGVGIERKNDKPPLAEVERVTVELIELRESLK